MPFPYSPDTVGFCISKVVDLADRDDLFEHLPNERIAELSRSSGQPGFRDAAHVLRAAGIRSRRILRPDVTPVDLAIHLLQDLTTAAEPLTDNCVILLAHSHAIPAAASDLAGQLARQLQLPQNQVLGFNPGCTGFLMLLRHAQQLLNQPASPSRVILLHVETPETWHCAADRQFCGLVGAAATGCVVQLSVGPLEILQLSTDSRPITPSAQVAPGPLFHAEHNQCVSFRGEHQQQTVMRMHGEAVYLHGIQRLLTELHAAAAARSALPASRPATTPPVIVAHQPGGKLLRAFQAAVRTEYPAWPVLANLLEQGNTISATIPAQLARLQQLLAEQTTVPYRPGQLLILLAAGIDMQRPADHLRGGWAIVRIGADDTSVRNTADTSDTADTSGTGPAE